MHPTPFSILPGGSAKPPDFCVGLPVISPIVPPMFVDVLGSVAGAITAFTFLPQVIKTWKEKSAKDISLTMFLIAASNNILWIIYGILKNDWVIILTNAAVFSMAVTMIILKYRYNK
jgi:MtN3 and saliva related transmembrane protein